MRKSIVIWEGGDEVLSAQGGLAVVGAMLADLPLGAALNQTCVPDAEHPEISHREIVTSHTPHVRVRKNEDLHCQAP